MGITCTTEKMCFWGSDRWNCLTDGTQRTADLVRLKQLADTVRDKWPPRVGVYRPWIEPRSTMTTNAACKEKALNSCQYIFFTSLLLDQTSLFSPKLFSSKKYSHRACKTLIPSSSPECRLSKTNLQLQDFCQQILFPPAWCLDSLWAASLFWTAHFCPPTNHNNLQTNCKFSKRWWHVNIYMNLGHTAQLIVILLYNNHIIKHLFWIYFTHNFL